MFKILVVEDDKNLRKLIVTCLRKNDYMPFEATNGEEALEVLDTTYIDLIISDIMMPKMDGYELTKTLREAHYNIPILLVTAKSAFEDKKEGFLLGADDYMVKPINIDEMILRIQVLLRRAKLTNEKKIQIDDFCLDYDQLLVTKKEKIYQLTQKEFYLLYKLLSTPNVIFTRQELIEEIWGLENESEFRTIDVHIKRIREKLQDVDNFEIATIRGIGYKGIVNSKGENMKLLERVLGKRKSLQRSLVKDLLISLLVVSIIAVIGFYFLVNNSINLKLDTININKKEDALEILNIIRRSLAITAITVILISGIFMKLVAAKILKPINQLKDATKKVAAGDFSVELETERKDEIGDLTHDFNKMVKGLSSIECLQKDFINNVSHEIKTPITSVQGFAKLLDDDSLNEEERKEYISIIIEESDRLLNISTNILKLSKLQNQERLVNKEEIEVSEQIRKVISILEPKWKERNLKFNVNLQDVIYYGDADLTFQVWMNLIDNAIKFSEKNSHIDIKVKKEKDAVLIVIKDYGIGMDETEKEKIFDRFYQIDKSHSEKGSGLGLAIVKRIIELSSGNINIESQKGKGTSITVKLPIETENNKIVIK